MPRLVHPQNAVDRLHVAAGRTVVRSVSATSEYDFCQSGPASSTGPLAAGSPWHGGRCCRPFVPDGGATRAAPTPVQLGTDRQSAKLRMEPVQEHEGLGRLEQVPQRRERLAGQGGKASLTRAWAQARSFRQPSGRNRSNAALAFCHPAWAAS